MKKYMIKIPSWTLIFGLSLLGISTHRTLKAGFKVDLRDDFTFSLMHTPDFHHARMMKVDQVAAIFKDKLTQAPLAKPHDLARHLVKLARDYRFDPAFLLSLMHVESRFRAKATSPAGAVGLMQLMPATALFISKRMKFRYQGLQSLLNPFTNLTLGVAYLKYLRDKYQDDAPYFHIAAYNIGPARLDELRARKSFRPTGTKKYYEEIVRGVAGWREYGIAASSNSSKG